MKTHCKRGHEFTDENTITKKYGRQCRACKNLLSRKHYVEFREDILRNRADWVREHRDEHLSRRRKISRTVSSRFAHLKGHAPARGILVSISFEDFKKLNSLPCDYCKGPLPETGHGLDRKDNSKGYELDNVVPCCYDCNTMKGKFLTYEEMHLIWELRMKG